MIFSVDFGEAQTGVGYRLIQANGGFVGLRVTNGTAARREAGDVRRGRGAVTLGRGHLLRLR